MVGDLVVLLVALMDVKMVCKMGVYRAGEKVVKMADEKVYLMAA